MSLYVDSKFVSLVSPKLERFKQKSEYLWNFRCPICGDSHKNKFKSRGYFYRRKSNLFFTCHNCGTSLSFGNFLKSVDNSLYREYQVETYKEQNHSNVAKPDFSEFICTPTFENKKINLPTIDSLHEEHEAKTYLLKRKLPRDMLNDIYYTSDFKEFVREIVPNFDKPLIAGEKRIIFPFYDEKNNLLGFQGRAIGTSKIKYITIKLNDDARKIFGLNRLDFNKKIYVVEGIIDSLFLQNSIALMDASLFKVRTLLGDHDYVLIPDRDIRNKEVVKNVEKMIELKYNVCLLPSDFPGKDINEAIISGYTKEQIQSIIDRNTHQDLRAKLEFELWKKV